MFVCLNSLEGAVLLDRLQLGLHRYQAPRLLALVEYLMSEVVECVLEEEARMIVSYDQITSSWSFRGRNNEADEFFCFLIDFICSTERHE